MSVITNSTTRQPNENSQSTMRVYSEVRDIEQSTRRDLAVLEENVANQVETKSTFLASLLNSIKEEFPTVYAVLVKIGLISDDENTSERNHDSNRLSSGTDAEIVDLTQYSEGNIPSQRVNVPSNLQTYHNLDSIPFNATWIRYRNSGIVYVDRNPRDRRSSLVLVPQRSYEYLLGEGYNPRSGQTIPEFIERHLLIDVRLPSTWTLVNGNSRTIKTNKRIASRLNRVFREMERRNVRYNLESTHCWCWRSIQGPNANGMASNHALGFAIDFNPRNNPYRDGAPNDFPENFVSIFEQFGFKWGGRWNPPDMMHFEIPSREILA